MKAILLALAFLSATAKAADTQNAFFQCDVKPGEAVPFGKAISDVEKNKLTDKKTQEANKTLSKFISEQVMPSIVVSTLDFNTPAVFYFTTVTSNTGLKSTTISASFDVSTKLNFRNDLSYPMQDNALLKSVDIADRNSQIDISVKTMSPQMIANDKEIQDVEQQNAKIIQEMSSKLGAQMSESSFIPKMDAKVLFSEKKSPKAMTLKLENKKGQSMLGVELKQITGAISVAQVNGFFTLVYSFQSSFGISASISPSADSAQKFSDSNLQASGVYIVANTGDKDTQEKLKDLQNRVCTTNKLRLYIPSNVASTIQTIQHHN